ncbi:37S ribosomal protein MRP4 mitochondrial [Zalerion maritima]|uniref:37S ribosomal protein MRP4 mitochondrial n=1 Tax=Zalerion maritima TaxID=339359 RepID=A0AAD5RR31_9PEZI|nr:37S ribosomal protein MRP4 mitochondrial [Zalerion maritima]
MLAAPAPAYASEKRSRVAPALSPTSTPGAKPPKPKGRGLRHKYRMRREAENATAKIGADIQDLWTPDLLLANPPTPSDVTLELLMANQTHMGHATTLWNPENSRYILGVRENIHIISLEATASHLRRAARVVEEVAYRGGIILFVGTRRDHHQVVSRAAQLADACRVWTRWVPGLITNREILLKSNLVRVVDENDQTIPGFDVYSRMPRPLIPDLVICLNPLENEPLLHECALSNIPTIGVIDTDANPSKVTYVIPANDDSLRSVSVVAGVLGRAGQIGNRRRLKAAKEGTVTWKTTSVMEDVIDQTRKRMESTASEAGFTTVSKETQEKPENAEEREMSPEDMETLREQLRTREGLSEEESESRPGAEGSHSAEPSITEVPEEMPESSNETRPQASENIGTTAAIEENRVEIEASESSRGTVRNTADVEHEATSIPPSRALRGEQTISQPENTPSEPIVTKDKLVQPVDDVVTQDVAPEPDESKLATTSEAVKATSPIAPAKQPSASAPEVSEPVTTEEIVARAADPAVVEPLADSKPALVPETSVNDSPDSTAPSVPKEPEVPQVQAAAETVETMEEIENAEATQSPATSEPPSSPSPPAPVRDKVEGPKPTERVLATEDHIMMESQLAEKLAAEAVEAIAQQQKTEIDSESPNTTTRGNESKQG